MPAGRLGRARLGSPEWTCEEDSWKGRRPFERSSTPYRDDLQVPEYFLFDPRGDWLPERLRGYELRAGEYLRIRPGPTGRLLSRQLGLELGEHEGRLRYRVPGADRPLPTATERAQLELIRADAAEAEVARLRAELQRLREGRA